MNLTEKSLPVASLLQCNPLYDKKKIERNHALYDGGACFDELKDSLLRARDIEKTGTPAAKGYRESRLACAHYTPHLSGILDYLCSASLQAPPSILADGPDKAYYTGLNKNVDGRGLDVGGLARNVLLQILLYKNAWLTVGFPKPGDKVYADYSEQKKAGALDGHLRLLDAACVDDWNEVDGKLEFVRTHTKELLRNAAAPYLPPRDELHTWTFYTATACYEYTATKEIEKTWAENATATLTAIHPHRLGRVPVVRACAGGLAVTDRLASTAIALWNRECSLAFALDSTALSLLYLKTKKDIKQIMLSEVAALKLDVGDEVGFAAPSAQMFEALNKDAEKLKSDLFGAITALALQAATNRDNPRQSAKAKIMDYGALTILIQTFAESVRDAIGATVGMLKEVRGDRDVITISGLDEYDVWSPESKLGIAKDALELPLPRAARNYIIESTALSVCADAPAETRELIRAEMKEIEKEENAEPEDADTTGKIPLALQQLALARQRFIETGDAARAAKVAAKMDELLATISV